MLEEIVGMAPLKQLLVAAFMLSLAGATISWLAGAFYLVRIAFNTKPGSLAGWLRFNPFSAAFCEERLTPKGMVLRKRLLICLGSFLAFWLLGMITGVVVQSVSSL